MTREREARPGVPQGSLTVDVVFYPGEGDGPLFAALAEPQQEGPRTFVAEQSLLPLLADEAHDGTSRGEKRESYISKTRDHPPGRAHPPVVPQRQQVPFNHVQDSLDPQPEGERLLVGALL